MADKTSPQKEAQSTAEEVDKSKVEEPTAAEDDSKSENGKAVENGEEVEKENGKEEDKKDEKKASADAKDNVCSVKRKSAGGDATSETPAEGATPEKKAKLVETIEAESNGEAEVKA